MYKKLLKSAKLLSLFIAGAVCSVYAHNEEDSSSLLRSFQDDVARIAERSNLSSACEDENEIKEHQAHYVEEGIDINNIDQLNEIVDLAEELDYTREDKHERIDNIYKAVNRLVDEMEDDRHLLLTFVVAHAVDIVDITDSVISSFCEAGYDLLEASEREDLIYDLEDIQKDMRYEERRRRRSERNQKRAGLVGI